MFPNGLIFGGSNCLNAMSQIHTPYVISSTVNYRLFTHSDISDRINEENDNVMLELSVAHYVKG